MPKYDYVYKSFDLVSTAVDMSMKSDIRKRCFEVTDVRVKTKRETLCIMA